MHIEVDKMGEKVSGEQNSRLASSECILAVLKALSILERGYELPQVGVFIAWLLVHISADDVICGELKDNLVSVMCSVTETSL